MIMKYERIKEIEEKKFIRLTGIKSKTFEKILEILKKTYKSKRVMRNIQLIKLTGLGALCRKQN